MLLYKISLITFKRIIVFFSANEIKLGINNRKKSEKYLNMWKLNNTNLNNPSITKGITRRIRKYFELNENKKQRIKILGYS